MRRAAETAPATALRFARPALALPVKDIPEGPGWALEPKWDGWRRRFHTRSGRVWNRNGTDLTHPFSDVAHAARSLPDAVLDGELVAVTDTGEVAFERLQSRAGRGAAARRGLRRLRRPLRHPRRQRNRGSGWVKWRQRHRIDAAVIGVTGTTPAAQAFILGRSRAGRMRPVGVSLPVGADLRRAAAPLLHRPAPRCANCPERSTACPVPSRSSICRCCPS
ncbi:hypothetical protein [Streptomyces sp. NPDC048248]|uniref:ATP-dependent DNA ligase n=1 Tax=Streptomyces sp. NPDC048248 TaxID=3365523 RepID=UPI0037242EF6